MSREEKIKGANKLLKDIKKKKDNWNERSCFTIKGVKNLSVADLDTLELYATVFLQNGGYNFYGLMKPLGSVKEVLDKYNVTEEMSFAF
ncbi:MAG: hypothetical protein ACOCRK_03695 [bacterium]